MKKCSVFLVSSSPIILMGLETSLNRCVLTKVVGTSHESSHAVHRCKEITPSIVIIDCNLVGENGITTAHRLKKHLPNTKVIALISNENSELVHQVVQSGAKGCLSLNSTAREIITAVERVHSGETSFSANLAQTFFSVYLARGGSMNEKKAKSISERERQVLQQLVDGSSNKEMADKLSISVRTIEKHRQRIMKKLDAHKATDLVRTAITEGIVVPSPTPSAFSRGGNGATAQISVG